MLSGYRNRNNRRIALAVLLILLVLYLYTHPGLRSTPAAVPHDVSYVPTSFDWGSFEHKHPRPSELIRLPQGTPIEFPKVQYDFAQKRKKNKQKDGRGELSADILAKRRSIIRNAFVKSWKAYKTHAWMHDEVAPLTLKPQNPFGGLGATLVDALDTLWIMNLKTDFNTAVHAVASLDFMATHETALNLFETTIRHLGGLLSAHDLSGSPILLRKAVELGDMLLAGFDTPNRMPGFWLNFEEAKSGKQQAGTADPAASPASLSLEFTRLAQLTGNDTYYDAVARVSLLLESTQNTTRIPGLWPTLMNFRHGKADHGEFTFGALVDSLFEYLPKMHILLGGLEPSYERMYRDAMDAATQHLLVRPMTPDGDDVLFSGVATVWTGGDIHLRPESQHLACFAGGMYALGGKLFDVPGYLETGGRLARGCAWGYAAQPSGLLPEIFEVIPCPSVSEACEWNETHWLEHKEKTGVARGFKHARDPRYQLRPEAIESLFLMYRMTGDSHYQELAWGMWEAVFAATETEAAFAAVKDVTKKGDKVERADSMESFWFAETLKYFYLIFSPPDLISLDEYVLNTEAHPLKRPKAGRRW